MSILLLTGQRLAIKGKRKRKASVLQICYYVRGRNFLALEKLEN